MLFGMVLLVIQNLREVFLSIPLRLVICGSKIIEIRDIARMPFVLGYRSSIHSLKYSIFKKQ